MPENSSLQLVCGNTGHDQEKARRTRESALHQLLRLSVFLPV